MKSITIREAKTNLSAVLSEISKTGEGYVICRNGHPVADLTPHRTSRCMTPHSKMKKIRIDYDPTEQLSSGEWPMDTTP